jgi:hypothetical protein
MQEGTGMGNEPESAVETPAAELLRMMRGIGFLRRSSRLRGSVSPTIWQTGQ